MITPSKLLNDHLERAATKKAPAKKTTKKEAKK